MSKQGKTRTKRKPEEIEKIDKNNPLLYAIGILDVNIQQQIACKKPDKRKGSVLEFISRVDEFKKQLLFLEDLALEGKSVSTYAGFGRDLFIAYLHAYDWINAYNLPSLSRELLASEAHLSMDSERIYHWSTGLPKLY